MKLMRFVLSVISWVLIFLVLLFPLRVERHLAQVCLVVFVVDMHRRFGASQACLWRIDFSLNVGIDKFDTLLG